MIEKASFVIHDGCCRWIVYSLESRPAAAYIWYDEPCDDARFVSCSGFAVLEHLSALAPLRGGAGVTM